MLGVTLPSCWLEHSLTRLLDAQEYGRLQALHLQHKHVVFVLVCGFQLSCNTSVIDIQSTVRFKRKSKTNRSTQRTAMPSLTAGRRRLLEADKDVGGEYGLVHVEIGRRVRDRQG